MRINLATKKTGLRIRAGYSLAEEWRLKRRLRSLSLRILPPLPPFPLPHLTSLFSRHISQQYVETKAAMERSPTAASITPNIGSSKRRRKDWISTSKSSRFLYGLWENNQRLSAKEKSSYEERERERLRERSETPFTPFDIFAQVEGAEHRSMLMNEAVLKAIIEFTCKKSWIQEMESIRRKINEINWMKNWLDFRNKVSINFYGSMI